MKEWRKRAETAEDRNEQLIVKLQVLEGISSLNSLIFLLLPPDKKFVCIVVPDLVSKLSALATSAPAISSDSKDRNAYASGPGAAKQSASVSMPSDGSITKGLSEVEPTVNSAVFPVTSVVTVPLLATSTNSSEDRTMELTASDLEDDCNQITSNVMQQQDNSAKTQEASKVNFLFVFKSFALTDPFFIRKLLIGLRRRSLLHCQLTSRALCIS